MTKPPKAGDVVWINSYPTIFQAQVVHIDGDWLFVKNLDEDRRSACHVENIASPEIVEARRRDKLKERISAALYKASCLDDLDAALAALEGGDK